MTDSFLKNDGGFILLNSGGTLLMNEHVPEVKIHGFHATQKTVQRRKTKLIPVSFTFKLKANTLRKIHVHLTSFGEILRPKGIYNDTIRNSFKIPLTELSLKLKQIVKQIDIDLPKLIRQDRIDKIVNLRESIVKDEDFILDFVLLKWLNKKIRKMKK